MDDNQNVQTPAGENDTPVILPVEEETKELEEETPVEETTPEAPAEEAQA